MKAKPLSKEIHKKALELGVQRIALHFSGGNDEGYLNVELVPFKESSRELEAEVEEWAWSVYSYSGAGDGNDYGDDIVYDLKKNTVTISDWMMQRHDNEEEQEKLELD